MSASPFETITLGGYSADIVASRSGESVWYYVIQPKGSREIVALGSCLSYEDTRAVVLRTLKTFASSAAAGE